MSARSKSDIRRDQLIGVAIFLSLWEVSAQLFDKPLLLPPISAILSALWREYLEQNTDLATAIACANLETNAWINSGKESFVSYVTDNVRGADENAVEKFYDVAMKVNMFPTEPTELLDTDGYQSLADLMYDGGELKDPLDASGFIDSSFLEKASEMGCGKA